MAENGVRTVDFDPLAAVDELLGNRDGSVGRVPVGSLATQLAGGGVVASVATTNALGDRIETLEDGQTSGLYSAESWTQLLSYTPDTNGVGGFVHDDDTGQHNQASLSGYVGALVDNAGRYRWNLSLGLWVRIGSNRLSGLDDEEAARIAADDALSARIAALETIEIDSLTIAGGTIYELGQSVAMTLNWSLSGAGAVTDQKINGADVANGARSWTSAAITNDTTFTLTVTDASARNVSRSVSVDFRNRVYWGASDALVTNSAGVLALEGGGSAVAASRARSFTVTTDGEQYVYYAIPTTFGQPSDVIAYGFPTDATITTISLTSAAGHTESYYLIRLDQKQNGTVPVEVN